MENLMVQLQEAVTTLGPSLLGAILILFFGYFVSRAISDGVRKVRVRAKVDDTLVAFLGNLLYMGLMTLVVISALGRIGVNTTSFAAIIAAAGLAIGFALQGSLANFAAGVMLILFRPFQAGDFVEVAGVSGTIEEIQIFATRLCTPDNKQIVLPNALVTADSVTNYSAKDTRRIDLVIGIGYGDDIPRAKATLDEILAADSRVLKDPAPTVAVSELGDSSVNFVVRPWVETAEYWNVRFALLERIKLEFDARGISIPFPQTDVHLHQVA